MYYFFDFRGAYLGYLDGKDFYDESGVRWGRLANGRKVVGADDGRMRGYLNAQGCFFEPGGACRGYLRDAEAQPPRVELR